MNCLKSGKIAIDYFGYGEALFFNFIILSMTGLFTAIVRAPITGIVLITEMTGSFQHLLSLTIVSIVAYVVADLLKSNPIYESLLSNMTPGAKSEQEEVNQKIILDGIVHYNAPVANKLVHEIPWPKSCLLLSIKRRDEEVIPKGDTMICEGDYLLFLTDSQHEWKTRESLQQMIQE